jgi:hypothetical protein
MMLCTYEAAAAANRLSIFSPAPNSSPQELSSPMCFATITSVDPELASSLITIVVVIDAELSCLFLLHSKCVFFFLLLVFQILVCVWIVYD